MHSRIFFQSLFVGGVLLSGHAQADLKKCSTVTVPETQVGAVEPARGIRKLTPLITPALKTKIQEADDSRMFTVEIQISPNAVANRQKLSDLLFTLGKFEGPSLKIAQTFSNSSVILWASKEMIQKIAGEEAVGTIDFYPGSLFFGKKIAPDPEIFEFTVRSKSAATRNSIVAQVLRLGGVLLNTESKIQSMIVGNDNLWFIQATMVVDHFLPIGDGQSYVVLKDGQSGQVSSGDPLSSIWGKKLIQKPARPGPQRFVVKLNPHQMELALKIPDVRSVVPYASSSSAQPSYPSFGGAE